MQDLGVLRKRSRVVVIRAEAGEGKTTLATHFSYQSYLAEGTHIYANYHFNEEHIDNFTYMSNKEILKDIGKDQDERIIRDGILIIDEVSKIASARKFATKVNQTLLELVSERRKMKIDIIFIGQASSMFDRQLREQATHLVQVTPNPDKESEFGYVVQDLKDMDHTTQAPRVVNQGVFDSQYLRDLELFDTEETIDKVYEDKDDKKKKQDEEEDLEEEIKPKKIKTPKRAVKKNVVKEEDLE